WAITPRSAPVTRRPSLHDALPISDSLFQAEGALFLDRFRDTLDRGAADALGNQYLVLRAAKAMGEDHDRTLAELLTAITRLKARSEEHTSELQSRENLVCRLLLEK